MFDFEQLRDALELAVRDAEEGELDLRAYDASGLSPWLFWTLIGLVRHHARQQWVLEVVRDRLGCDPAKLAIRGYDAHPEVGRGPVPGDENWEFYFHGCGCQLTHRASEMSIDVDFFDETADWIFSYFYRWFLCSLRTPEPPEGRLRDLHPSQETVVLSFEELHDLGLLIRHGEEVYLYNAYKLRPEILELKDLVDRFCDQMNDPARMSRLAAAAGDWLLAERLTSADRPDYAAANANAERCRQERFQVLDRRFFRPHVSGASRLALVSMDEIDLPRLDAFMQAALAQDDTSLAAEAIRIARRRNDARWCEQALAAYARPDACEPLFAQYLFECGYRYDEVAAGLLRFTRSSTAEAAILALEHAPQHARQLLRQALRSGIPYARGMAAAVLAVIDLPWCCDELKSALFDVADVEATRKIRAALALSHNPSAQEAILRWRGLYQSARPSKSTEDLEETEYGNSWLRFYMSQVRERIIRFRDSPPPPEPTIS